MTSVSISTKRDELDMSVHRAAVALDLDQVKRCVAAGGSVHMAIMGAGDVLEDPDTDVEQRKLAEAIAWWAVLNGACLLLKFSQGVTKSKFSVLKYNKNISMLKGPGEVARGTFNQN